MKKRFAAAFLLAGFAVGVIAGVVLSKCLKKDDGYIFITAIPIDDITDKFYKVNNQRSGKGHYIWANGDDYEGEWKNNMADGEGTLRTADGTKYKDYGTGQIGPTAPVHRHAGSEDNREYLSAFDLPEA